jgi:hypothetical protein
LRPNHFFEPTVLDGRLPKGYNRVTRRPRDNLATKGGGFPGLNLAREVTTTMFGTNLLDNYIKLSLKD